MIEYSSEFQLGDGTVVNVDASSDSRFIFTLKSPTGDGDSFLYDPATDLVGDAPRRSKTSLPKIVEAVSKWLELSKPK